MFFAVIYIISDEISLGEILIWISVLVFTIYLNFSTKYIVSGQILIVKCGFLINKKYEIQNIKSISKTRNLISSPAPSLDRISLKYDKFDEIILSPKDKNEFARELLKINPEIINDLN